MDSGRRAAHGRADGQRAPDAVAAADPAAAACSSSSGSGGSCGPRARAEGRRPAGVAGTTVPAATAVVAACRMLRERRFFFTAAGELAEEIVTKGCRSNGRNYFLLSWPNEKARSGGSLTYRNADPKMHEL